MEHFNSILFHKSGPANKQHTYQSITLIFLEAVYDGKERKNKTIICIPCENAYDAVLLRKIILKKMVTFVKLCGGWEEHVTCMGIDPLFSILSECESHNDPEMQKPQGQDREFFNDLQNDIPVTQSNVFCRPFQLTLCD